MMTSDLVIIFPPKVYTSEPRCALVLPDRAWRSRRAVVGSGFPPRPRSKKHGGCRAHAPRNRAAATEGTDRRTECSRQQRRRGFSPEVWLFAHVTFGIGGIRTGFLDFKNGNGS